jgi:hypothetical protein
MSHISHPVTVPHSQYGCPLSQVGFKHKHQVALLGTSPGFSSTLGCGNKTDGRFMATLSRKIHFKTEVKTSEVGFGHIA